MLDIFNSDAFNVVSLTTALNKAPFQPSRLGSMGLFKARGITTTTAVIEERFGELMLIPTQARGSMPNVMSDSERNARAFKVPHIPLNSAVWADDVQGVRAFGSETQIETVSQKLNDKLEAARQSFEVTHEWHRIGAIQGNILDADGISTIYNLFTEFGITESEVDFDFTDTDNPKLTAQAIKRLIRGFLGATPFTGIHAMCGDAFFDDLVTSLGVKDAYDRYLDGEFKRTLQDGDGGFPFAGITWENYHGSIGSQDFIDTDTARFFPLGVNGLFETIFAPANFVETVNTIGRPTYAKQERMRFDMGYELHTQSNPLIICTRPSVLIKGNRIASSSSSSSSS